VKEQDVCTIRGSGMGLTALWKTRPLPQEVLTSFAISISVLPGSMLEMSNAREDHGHAVFIRGGNHFFISH
jgi:hypothetical protein